MKTLKALLLLPLTAVALACSTTPPPQVAYDRSFSFAGLKTFDWYADPAEEKSVGGAIVDARWVNDHVKAAVNAELEKKGLRPAGSGTPDFYVDYHTRSGGIAERDQYGVYSWWTGMPTGANYYKEAILILDVRDAQKKLIWRGSDTKVLGTDPEQLDRQVKSAVATLFRNFPPGVAGS
jgi:Domain of unknown function (DUF4136)